MPDRRRAPGRGRRRGLVALVGLLALLAPTVPAYAAAGTVPALGSEQCDQVRQIIHRGNGGDDNTIEQIGWAARHGNGVEVDLRRTSDGSIVLMHSDDLFEVTTSHGSLDRTTLAEVRRLRTKHGERVATLSRFVRLMRNAPVQTLQLELKVSFTPAQVATLVRTLDRAGFGGKVVLTSTLVSNLRAVYRADPFVPTGWIAYDPFVPDLDTAAAAHVDWVMVGQNALFVWPHYVQDAAARGIRVQGRLVSAEEATLRGIRRITTDDPSSCDPPAPATTSPTTRSSAPPATPAATPAAVSRPAPQPTTGPLPHGGGSSSVARPVAQPGVALAR